MWFRIVGVFFLFKQKTAYERRISDWSSDVCSSDLANLVSPELVGRRPAGLHSAINVCEGGLSAECLQCVLNRSEEHTSELQSLMRISYAVFCLTKTKEL